MLFDRANNVQPRDEADGRGPQGPGRLRHQERAMLQASGDKKDVAQYHVGRIPLLRAVVKASKTAEDQLIYNKQVVDSLVAALPHRASIPRAGRCWTKLVAEGRQARLVRGLQPDRRRLRHEERRSPAPTSWPTRRSGWPTSRTS